MRVIEARYGQGLLKPREPLALRARETVGLIVVRRPDPKRWNLERLRKCSTADAALAEQGLGDWAAELGKKEASPNGRIPFKYLCSSNLNRLLPS